MRGAEDGPEPAGSGDATIRIGYVTSQTGALAAFGEADRFVVDRMTTYFANNRLTLGGEQHSVDIVTKDTQSDPQRTAEVTTELIDEDGVDLVLAQLAAPTPGTVNPVSDTCEAKGVPCITTTAPWETTWYGRGKRSPQDPPFDWSYHFYPFASSLTGQSAQQLADQYEQQTGQQWTQPIGFVHALFEVAVAALAAADGADPRAVADAVEGLAVDTVVGDVRWGQPGLPANVAKTPLVGGQWRATPGGPNPVELEIVSNALARDVSVDGPARPLG